MKTVLFAPGFTQTPEHYPSTFATIEDQGYNLAPVPITWNGTTIDEWVEQFDNEYRQYDPQETILAGFSFGAMTACITAARRNPSELWLCSLSGYFSEDLSHPDRPRDPSTQADNERLAAFGRHSFEDVARSIGCRTLLFAGQKELDTIPMIRVRFHDTPQRIKVLERYIAPEAGHDITDPNYIATLQQAIENDTGERRSA